MHKDFVDETPVKFKVKGQEWAYKPVTPDEELRWLNEYAVDGKNDLQKLHQCKVRNLVECPYSEEVVADVIGVSKKFVQLGAEEKWKFVSKLKAEVYNELIQKIDKINQGDDIKNSSGESQQATPEQERSSQKGQ